MHLNSYRKLRAPDAASYLSLSQSTLAKMRLRGDGPPYAKAGRRVVLYDVRDLDAWLDARRRTSTSDPGATGIEAGKS
jgi:predicted DNA-binding transcriptional regulator AlpA